MVTIDSEILGLVLTVAIPAAGALIALGVKVIYLNQRVKTLEDNPLIAGWNQFNRVQAIDLFDRMINRIEREQGEEPNV